MTPEPTAPFENRSLFSDHFLAERLPALAGWAGDDLVPAWEAVRERWRAVRDRLPGMNEGQTEAEWIRPVLEALGWTFDVQPAVRGISGRHNAPDYALFTGAAARDAAGLVRAEEGRYWEAASAVADAKAWGRSLDAAGRGADLSNANPSFQIVGYMVVTGVQWAVLTNGREWRLYAARARSRVDTYFAVDLARVLEADGPEAFRWFHRFFGADGFRRDAATGASFLDRVLRGSAEYGAGLEVRLKKLVFEKVFGELARGFVSHRRRRGLPVEGEAELREVYEGTLRLLYRLLFLLHAEARDLLPVRERGYGRYSLLAARRKVAEAAREGDVLSAVSTDLWNDLDGLFRIIDEGDARIGVPRYNGGLFRRDHPRNRFLAEHQVADAFLYPALDGLSRDADGKLIDYKALDVEQLGSLYEGLLEFRLRLDADDAPVLENDKGERHATGSYYTPHYVVEYIVAETVGPVVAERAAAFREAVEAASARGAPADAPLRLERAAEALLSIRVCDPAMGSGHFLVHAANWLTERLMAVLSEYPENPVLARLAAVREEILARLSEEGIAVDPDHLRDTALLKRLVIKRCIYGVDLNPMATELAKLSLWLDSFTVGAPLSFLDHHLKHGNSLVGTRVLEVSRAMEENPQGQRDAFGGPFAHVLRAAELMREVSTRTDASFEEVSASAERFAEFEAVMRPYKRLLDLWVSRGFGNRRAEELASGFGAEVLEHAKGRGVRFGKDQAKALETAERLAEELRFFHWDLEFPEVFVDLERARWKENPGFEVVIGNPPYVRQEQVKALKPYFASAYADVHDGAADLYVYFYREGLELLRGGGRLSFIVTNKWLRAGYGQGLRRVFSERAEIERIVDFGHAPIFPDADVFPCIVVVRRPEDAARPASTETQVTLFPREALDGGEIGSYIAENAYPVRATRFSAGAWSLETEEVHALMEKIHQAGVPLADFIGAKPLRGVLTGFNEAFVLTSDDRARLIASDPASETIIKPFLRGQDIDRWSPEWAGLWMIVLKSGENHTWPWTGAPKDAAERIFRETYPAIHRHMKQHEKRLRARQDQGQHWWELRSCAYYDAFERPKIIHTDITWRASFAFAREPIYLLNTAYIWPTDDLYALAVVNSPVMWTYMWRHAIHGKDDALRLIYSFTETLPIARPTPEVRSAVEPAVQHLIDITGEAREARFELLDWLRSEYGIDKPGQKLERFDDLTSDDFVAAVRERLPRGAASPGPRQVAALRNAHADYAPRLNSLAAVAAGLERKLAQLVNEAYGLTPEEVELMWRTAPPRMPVGR